MEVPSLQLLITISLVIHNAAGFYKTVGNQTIKEHNNVSITFKRLGGEGLSGGSYSELYRVPYQAQICKGYLIHCGAVIISRNWLVTAAHCCANQNFSKLKLITGTQISCGSTGTKHVIETVIVHSKYDSKTLNNDICLIKLQKPIEVTSLQKPIKVAKKAPPSGALILISGYGKEEGNLGQAPSLKIAKVPVLPGRRCSALYEKAGDKMPDTAFCAGGSIDSACFGDSGGPAAFRNSLVGIISAGRDCGSPTFPTIFTQVVSFYQWIEQHTDIGTQ